MKIKINLHLHTNDDPEDNIDYSFLEALDEAKNLGFECLALTCHNKFINSEEYRLAAEERNILFIPGIEKTIEKRHVVILNSDKEVENIKTFEELREYKKTHTEIFILAAHPYFPGGYSLCKKLEINKDLFDAIEHSWFYSKHIDLNKKAERFAKDWKIPFIATSDTHKLKFLDTNYTEVEVKEKTIGEVFNAIKNNNFSNTTLPRKLFVEMTSYVLSRFIDGHKKPNSK
ncbi:MAG: PHP-associated domain-containing protein [bacterium]